MTIGARDIRRVRQVRTLACLTLLAVVALLMAWLAGLWAPSGEARGPGSRNRDTDHPTVSSLDVRAFALWAGLSGVVPRIAVVKGRCFAGNAVIAGSIPASKLTLGEEMKEAIREVVREEMSSALKQAIKNELDKLTM